LCEEKYCAIYDGWQLCVISRKAQSHGKRSICVKLPASVRVLLGLMCWIFFISSKRFVC